MENKNADGAIKQRGENIDKRLGKRFKEYRKKKGFTQEQLGEKVGASAMFISQIERGTAFPRNDNFIAILDALDITANDIYMDVLKKSCEVKSSILSGEIETLPYEEQNRIFSVVETMIQEAKKRL